MDSTIFTNLVLLATFGCQAAGKLTMKPIDTDVKVNHSTYFNCSTDFGSTAIFWYHGNLYVYTGNVILEPYQERFKIDKNTWNGTYSYNLIIQSVQPNDAGKFICAEDEGFGEQHAAQLIVLDGDPICKSNIEGDEVIGQNMCNIEPDEVELECSVTYHGNFLPHMEWKKVGDNSSSPLEEVSVVTYKNHYVSTLRLKGDITLNNSSYICETKRTAQESSNCTSQVIKILYAVNGNLIVNGSVDEEIHCYADTSLSCNYKWKWLQDSDFTVESSTAILKTRKLGWHRCEAECYLRNETCKFLVMRAMVYRETESSFMSLIFTFVMAFSAAALIVAIFAYFKIVWKRVTSTHKAPNRRNLTIQTSVHAEIAGNSNEPSTDAAAREEHAFLEKESIKLKCYKKRNLTIQTFNDTDRQE